MQVAGDRQAGVARSCRARRASAPRCGCRGRAAGLGGWVLVLAAVPAMLAARGGAAADDPAAAGLEAGDDGLEQRPVPCSSSAVMSLPLLAGHALGAPPGREHAAGAERGAGGAFRAAARRRWSTRSTAPRTTRSSTPLVRPRDPGRDRGRRDPRVAAAALVTAQVAGFLLQNAHDLCIQVAAALRQSTRCLLHWPRSLGYPLTDAGPPQSAGGI